jgi:excisionase family DNA binding protein
MNEHPKLYPIPEAQEYLGGISRTTLHELAKRGEVAVVNIGRRAFITRASLDEYVERISAI